MGEVIVITSGKGGVGKTTTTANLGSSLALEGKKVVLIDTDIGLRNLDVVMGLENRIVYDIVDVVEGKCKLRQALIKDKRFKELYLLPAAQTRDKSAVNEEQMKELTDTLRKEFDYILIDCPAGIEQGFKNAIAGANRAIVVTTAEISAIRDADRIIGLLESSEIKNPELKKYMDNHIAMLYMKGMTEGRLYQTNMEIDRFYPLRKVCFKKDRAKAILFAFSLRLYYRINIMKMQG